VGLAKQIEEVFLQNAGLTDPQADKGKIPELAKGLATVIDDYIKSITFNVTNLDAVVQLDELVIKKPLKIDQRSLLNVQYVPFPAGVPATPVPVTTTGTVTTLPNQKLTKRDFEVKGRAFLGKAAQRNAKTNDQKYDRSSERNLKHATVSADPNSRNV